MSNQLGIVHPDLMNALSEFYPETCAIEEATESRNSMGEVTRSWSTLSGHGSIPCAVTTLRRPGEVRTDEQNYVQADYRIALAGNYAVTEDHRAVVGSVTYNILRVRHDQMSKTTYLDCEVVSR